MLLLPQGGSDLPGKAEAVGKVAQRLGEEGLQWGRPGWTGLQDTCHTQGSLLHQQFTQGAHRELGTSPGMQQPSQGSSCAPSQP